MQQSFSIFFVTLTLIMYFIWISNFANRNEHMQSTQEFIYWQKCILKILRQILQSLKEK